MYPMIDICLEYMVERSVFPKASETYFFLSLYFKHGCRVSSSKVLIVQHVGCS
ncbi:uncharacterized protein J3R85_008198 [Psidium guajava]|nr:uncharacterized protein J3R85_008198 [Psidium guajava]